LAWYYAFYIRAEIQWGAEVLFCYIESLYSTLI